MAEDNAHPYESLNIRVGFGLRKAQLAIKPARFAYDSLTVSWNAIDKSARFDEV